MDVSLEIDNGVEHTDTDKDLDSLELIYNMQHDLNCMVGMDTLNDPNKLDMLFKYAFQIGDEAQELMKCSLTKWWVQEFKDGGKLFDTVLDKNNAKIEAIDILHFLMSVFQILDMTPEDIVKIYKLKYQKNIDRQKNGYSIAGKTEEDNLNIIMDIK